MTSGNVSRSLFGAVGKPSIVIMALPTALLADVDGDTPDARRGHRAYNTSCAVCHGAEGRDWNNIDLKSVKEKMTLEELVTFIKNPRAPMPKPFPEPLDAEAERSVRDIATFIMQWE